VADDSGDAWTVKAEEAGAALAGFVRSRLADATWSHAKKLVATGKVFVDDAPVLDVGHRLAAGARVVVRMNAPRPRSARAEVRIVLEDPHLVVIDKPSGVSSVPYEGETDTAMDLVRDAWRRMGRPATETALHVVHRIDKDTSGLLMFAKSKRAEIGLAALFRTHSLIRSYTCVAHGDVKAARIDTLLVDDRGDGIRGTLRVNPRRIGKRAITFVKPVRSLRGATLCEVTLQTGKTHQIRIHLSEAGHPLVGETVYIRDFLAAGKTAIDSPRLLLHAATLGFQHPMTGDRVDLTSPLPESFTSVLERLELRG
jgi:23S rRNA pseudouridine1911/1915/1917 synthase